MTQRTKLEAIRLLLERGWSRPPQEITIDGSLARVDVSRLSDDKLKQLHAAATVARQILDETS